MRQTDLFRIILNYMNHKRVRTVMTIIGITLGPAAIVALLGLVGGFGASITSDLSNIGVTTMYITAAPNYTMNIQTVDKIENLKGVKTVLPYYSDSGKLTQGTKNTTVTIYAIDLNEISSILPGLTIQNGSIVSPNFYSGADIGYSLAYPNTTGVRNLSINQVITISGSPSFSFGGKSISGTPSKTYSFLVKGIYKNFGQGLFINPDTSVFIPLSGGILLTNDTGKYSGILVSATNASAVTGVSSELSAEFGKNLNVITVSSILSEITSIESSISFILLAVASISLVVAFISIMTTMYTSVTERTTEIGILKALGFTPNKVILMFLYESLLIGFVGGVFGVIIGTGGSYIAAGAIDHLSSSPSVSSAPTPSSTTPPFSRGDSGFKRGAGFSGGSRFSNAPSSGAFSSPSSLNLKPVISIQLILEVLLLTSILGLIAGLLPAWKASRLAPAEALRSL